MSHLYLPLAANNLVVAGQVEGEQDAVDLFGMMAADPNQRRSQCIWNDKLAAAAGARANDMLTRNYFAHVDPDGHGPNWWVRQAGYKLPAWYADDANNVESISLNYLTAEQVWQGWLGSPVHRRHVLGESPFFAAQTNVGVGYVRASSGYPILWVLISCPTEEST